MNGKTDILVVGGGISGLSAAVEAAETGASVVLAERRPFLGGRVAQMRHYFPKRCPPICGLEILLRRVRTNPRLKALTLAEVTALEGKAGQHKASLKLSPRLVNDRCTACGDCVAACPAERPDDYNCGMSRTRAIYAPPAGVEPARYVIDAAACRGASCDLCAKACRYGAIDLGMKPETLELETKAVIWAAGWDPYDASRLKELGFGASPDVITNLMMERLASPNGPTGGKILRPSDGKPPASVAFVQCAGSRDENHLKHCSGVCCLASLKQARYVRDQLPEAKVSVFYIDLRAPGRLEEVLAETRKDAAVSLIKGKVAKVTLEKGTGNLVVEAEDVLSRKRLKEPAGLVVLATGMVPSAGGFADRLRRDGHGFLEADQRETGVLPAGCVRRPMEVAGCVRSAAGAVLKALQAVRG